MSDLLLYGSEFWDYTTIVHLNNFTNLLISEHFTNLLMSEHAEVKFQEYLLGDKVFMQNMYNF